jgi:multidrug resistance efflux pump
LKEAFVVFGKKYTVRAVIIFFVVVIICSFSAKTIYYFTLPKVAVERPRASTYNQVVNLSQGIAEIKGSEVVEIDLPAAITVDEVLVKKGQRITEGDTILRLNTGEIKKQLVALEKTKESAEIALSEFVRNFNQRVADLSSHIPKGMSGGVVSVNSTQSGIVISVGAKQGDTVLSGARLFEVADSTRLVLKLPFATSYDIKIGMSADVSIPSHMTVVSGTVKEIGGEVTTPHGSKGRMVSIEVVNPGTLTAGTEAIATIEGGIAPMEPGELEYSNVSAIFADTSGYVADVNVSLYEHVSAGATLMKIELPDGEATRDELNYMLTTGIYNGRTEKQLQDNLDEVEAAITVLRNLEETGEVIATTSGMISSLSVQTGMRFAGGTLYGVAPENSSYHIVFTSGELSSVEEGQKCSVYGYIDGRKVKANATIKEVGLGYAMAESYEISSTFAQAQPFYAEVTLDSKPIPISVPASAMVSSNYVYVVGTRNSVMGSEYIAVLREVTTGEVFGGTVEIISGLAQDEDVIVSWDRSLSDGAVIDIVIGK